MEVKILTKIDPVDILGRYDVVEFKDNREVYVDGERLQRDLELALLSMLDDMCGLTGKTFNELSSHYLGIKQDEN